MQDFSITIEDGEEIKKKYTEFEKLYEQMRDSGLLQSSITPPPKRKFLQADAKFFEKRIQWVEQLTQYLVNSHASKLVYFDALLVYFFLQYF